MSSSEAAAEVSRMYASELQELTFNSKPIINSLTLIAGENASIAASSISQLIVFRIKSAPIEHAMPAIYLMDSIVKNIGGVYRQLFSKHAAQMVSECWSKATDMGVKQSIGRLYRTWHGVFDESVVAEIESGRVGTELRALEMAKSRKQENERQQQVQMRAYQYQQNVQMTAYANAAAYGYPPPQQMMMPQQQQQPPPQQQPTTYWGYAAPQQPYNYAVQQPQQPPPTAAPQPQPLITAELASLLQGMTRAGSITPTRSVSPVATTMTTTTTVGGGGEAAFKLYGAMQAQCSTCGLRFADSSALTRHNMTQHHNHHNNKSSSSSKAKSRFWYQKKSQWIVSEPFQSEIDTVDALAGAINKMVMEKKTIPSVVADDARSKCFICEEKLEPTWDNNSEQWLCFGVVEDKETRLYRHEKCMLVQPPPPPSVVAAATLPSQESTTAKTEEVAPNHNGGNNSSITPPPTKKPKTTNNETEKQTVVPQQPSDTQPPSQPPPTGDADDDLFEVTI